MRIPDRHAIPLLVGALGLLSAGVPGPAGLAVLGLLLYGAAAMLEPWIIAPLVLLAVPFYLHPRVVAGLELSMAEAALIGGCLAVAAHLVLGRLRRSPLALRRLVPSPIDWAAAALLAAGLLSLLATEYPRQSLRELRWLLLEPVALFYVVRLTMAREGLASITLWALALSGAMASLLATAGLLAAGSFLDPATRAVAPYLSANHLGLFLERAAVVGLALALYGPWPPAGWASFLLGGWGVLRSLSAGAWLGLAASAGMLLVPRGRRWVVAAAGVLALGVAVAIVALPRERTVDRFNALTGTGLLRWEVWHASLSMAADHPILGVGLDNFLYQYRGGYMLPEAWREPNISHPHNWLLNFWLELGVLGLAAAVGAVAWTAKTAYRLFRAAPRPEDRAVAAANLGVLACFLAHGFVDNSYFLADLAVIWWVLLGLLENVSNGAGGRGVESAGGAYGKEHG